MPGRILVTGGTGQLGKVVVDRLLDAGERVRVLSRRPRAGDAVEWAVGDLAAGRGLDTAVAGTDVVVHCATTYRDDVGITRRLLEAIRWTGGAHLVYLSIVGVDRVPLGYYQAKHRTEQLIEASGLPYTIQRATQFHALLRTLFAGASRLPLMPVPAFRFQPVDVRDLAVRVAELALADPAGRAPDFGGPEIREATELAHTVAAATGRRRRVLPLRLPGATFRGYADGGNLTPEHKDGVITFDQYLAEQSDAGRVKYRG